MGYGGDALMAGESLVSNFDMSLFLEKRVMDFVAAQRPNGGFTETAPFVGISDAGLGEGSGPIGWEAYPTSASMWLVKYFGNIPAVQKAYPSATAYVEFLDTVDQSLIKNGLGDWMSLETKALPLTGLGFQYLSYLEFANMSRAIGNLTMATKYEAEAATIAAEINTAYLNPATGVYATPGGFNATQCGQAMPLFLQIVPPAAQSAAFEVLINNLAAHDGHLQVGAFGVKYLLMSLVDGGRADLAWGVVNNTEYPGFGYMLDGSVNGLTNATTIWESWFTSDNTCEYA
jgi:alpha-L-rhamnosidase